MSLKLQTDPRVVHKRTVAFFRHRMFSASVSVLNAPGVPSAVNRDKLIALNGC